MPTSPSVLLLGHDESLLQTRRWLLESNGLQVYIATHFPALNQTLEDHDVDLLILCHSLTAEECERAVAIVESHPPKLKVLALTTASSDFPVEKVDRVVNASDGPKTLLNIVARFMKNRLAPDS
jgi:DNA-binding response OmpR family regulator